MPHHAVHLQPGRADLDRDQRTVTEPAPQGAPSVAGPAPSRRAQRQPQPGRRPDPVPRDPLSRPRRDGGRPTPAPEGRTDLGECPLQLGLYELVGRDPACDHVIALPDFPRFAAKLLWDGRVLTVQPDLRTGAHSRVNTAQGDVALAFVAPGESFRVAHVEFTLTGWGRLSYRWAPPTTWPETPPVPQVTSAASSLGSEAAGSEPMLRGVNLTHPIGLFAHLDFEIPVKRLVALIGPTGVGKTSIFRTLLSGRCAAGSLLWDGEPLFGPAGPRLRFALVPQKPALIGNLKVKTLLRYAYFLKNRSSKVMVTTEQRRRRIADALKLAGFAWKTHDDRALFLDQFCANLSGGEEKRLSLALELLDYPDVLLLDEPDSGLDAHTAQRLFESMERLVAESSVQLLLLITHSLARLDPDNWVIALGTPAPGQRPAHVAYCGRLGRPGEPDGIYGSLGARDDAGIMEKLIASRPRTVNR